MFDRVREWWEGEFVGSSLKHILGEEGGGESHFRRPRLAKVMIVAMRFLKREWKWVVGTSISIAAVCVAYLRL
jgi:hypothetical protein